MKIAIEAQRIFRPNKHGMDIVILEVLRLLQSQDNDNQYYVFVAPGKDHCIESTERMKIIELNCPTYFLWEQWALPRAIKKMKVDLLHCTSNTAPIYCSIPLILTLHDIIYLQSKKNKGMSLYQQLGWYYRRWNIPHIINNCDHIITVSETERERILSYFSHIKNKLSVVHNGYSDFYHPMPNAYEITKKYIKDQEYIFFLGNTDPRKNTVGVLLAYAEYIAQSSKKLKLVITGLNQEYVEKLLTQLNIKNCKDMIVYTNYVPSEDMSSLYNNAFAFLFPSLLEGFGIPILESMACGTPVITSNISAMPEVAGKDGILVDPQNPQEIANALLKLEQDDKFYHKQVDYGLDRVKLYSWKKTTKEYIKIYKSIYHF